MKEITKVVPEWDELIRMRDAIGISPDQIKKVIEWIAAAPSPAEPQPDPKEVIGHYFDFKRGQRTKEGDHYRDWPDGGLAYISGLTEHEKNALDWHIRDYVESIRPSFTEHGKQQHELKRKLYAPAELGGKVTVTTDPLGYVIAVTRTDDENRILEVIWEAEHSAMGPVRALPAAQVAEPVAWMVPHLLDVHGAERTSLPKEHHEEWHGTVAWSAEVFSDGDGVTDKNGVHHRPKPLGYINASDVPAQVSAHPIHTPAEPIFNTTTGYLPRIGEPADQRSKD